MGRSLAREAPPSGRPHALWRRALQRRRAHVRNDGRWKLTDAQRFAMVLAVVFALFLSAMSWGM